jgi:8-oxo-dGTP diphosphatase
MSTPDFQPTNSFLTPYAGLVRVRVGGVLVRNGAILLAAHRGLLPNEATFWSPPGGGWAFGESLKQALQREFLEETGLAVRVGRQLHLHEFRHDNLQALEIFFEVIAEDPHATPRLGHDPEHAADAQLLTALAWYTPRQLLALPLAQVHPVLRGLLSTDDIFVPQVLLHP